MFRILCQPEIFKPKTTKEQYKKWHSDFMQCLKGLDLKLVEHTFLCGEKITIGDIVVFNELSLFMELNDYTPDHEEMAPYPNLMKWFKTKMLGIQVVKALNDEMKDSLSKVKKTIPQA